MALIDTIQEDLTTALKAGDSSTSGVLRMLTAAFKNKEIEKRGKSEDTSLSNEEVQSVIQKEAKKRKEAIEAYQNAGRNELAENERKELTVIEKYLPKMMDEAEVRAVVKEALQGATPQNIGEAMKHVMPKVKGRADGALVSKIVKEYLK